MDSEIAKLTIKGNKGVLEKEVGIEYNGDIVTKIQVDEELSEEKGIHESVFHYRLEKEVGAGIDHETGEPCEIYCTIKIEHMNEIDYERFHKKIYVYDLALQADCDPKYIIPITKEEYDRAMDY